MTRGECGALLADIALLAANSVPLLEEQPSILPTHFQHNLQVHDREGILLKLTSTNPWVSTGTRPKHGIAANPLPDASPFRSKSPQTINIHTVTDIRETPITSAYVWPPAPVRARNDPHADSNHTQCPPTQITRSKPKAASFTAAKPALSTWPRRSKPAQI
jgi:hypothetical protein